ncbi:MAG: hypothetical protein NZM04_04105, partial [Methylacidiphilales bacterium]|nr:hypothetical protein [Candidatus Methylacidiphilales bacterium]
LWSLAKLEKKTGNWKIAAETFDTYARTPGVPSALALMARIEWLDALLQGGDSKTIERAIPTIQNALSQHQAYERLLDVGRRLLKIQQSDQVRNYALEIIAEAKRRGIAALQRAESIDEKRLHAHRLIRFMAYDYPDQEGIVALWQNEIANHEKNYNDNSPEWWELAALAMAANGFTNRMRECERLYQQWISSPSISDYGKLELWIKLGDLLIDQKEYKRADEIYTAIVALNLSHHYTGYGHYWLMLRALGRGQEQQAKTHAREVVRTMEDQKDYTLLRGMYLRAKIVLGTIDPKERKEAVEQEKILRDRVKRYHV